MANKTKPPKCLIDGCDLTGNYGRGLCPKHYQALYYRVATGKTTWAELEAIGMCLTIGTKRENMTKMDELIEAKRRAAQADPQPETPNG